MRTRTVTIYTGLGSTLLPSQALCQEQILGRNPDCVNRPCHTLIYPPDHFRSLRKIPLIQELTAPALESITSLASQSGGHFKSLTKRNIVVWTMAVEGVSRYLGDLRYTFLVSEGSCFVSWKHLQSKLRAVQAREKLCLHFACYNIKVHTLLQFLPGCSVWVASVGQHKKLRGPRKWFSSRLAGSRLAFNNSGRSTLDSPGGLEWSNSSLIVLPLKGFSGFT